jgi:competence protein ComEA
MNIGQKLRYWLRSTLGYNRREANGLLLLVVLLGLFALVPAAINRLMPVPTLASDTAQINLALRNLHARQLAEAENQAAAKPSYKLFLFDPNVASQAELESLGFFPKLAERLIKYRSKGGKFRQRSDLAKIYFFPPALYQRLYAYIDLPELAGPDTSGKRWPTYKSRPKLVLLPFDINEVDSAGLVALPGIGPGFARRIMIQRERLGGFTALAQLRDIWGLDSLAIDEVLKYARLSPDYSPKPLRINYASLEQLKLHPYMPWRLARLIVAYRLQHGPFTKAEDILKIKVAKPEEVEKLKPYLSFE